MAEYLQWRGAAWHFRIGVPHSLRPVIGRCEITISLGQIPRAEAKALALNLAGKALVQFYETSLHMDEEKLKTVTQLAKERNKRILAEEHAEELRSAHTKLERQLQKKDQIISVLLRTPTPPVKVTPVVPVTPVTPVTPVAPVKPVTPVKPTHLQLSALVKKWLEEREEEAKSKATGQGKERKGQAVFRDDQRIINLFLHTIGDINAIDLKRSKILEYLDLVAKMPVSSGDPAPFRACKSVHDFIEANMRLSDPKPTIRFSSMNATHIARLRLFLAWCHSKYVDDGFPATLQGVVKNYKYKGANKGGDKGNRPFTPVELQKLFEGEFMAELAGDPANHERYWLLHLGLFTGMRIGETFLINPQTDIVEQDGVMLMQLTEQTEKAPNVLNSIKKNDEDGSKDRDIPVHSKLIELGFLDYVERCKTAGHKTLFPTLAAAEKPEHKASKEVTECFKRAGVHDPETKGKGAERGKLAGFHAFRGTMAHTAIAADVSHKPAHFYIMGRADPNADPTERKHYASKPPTARLKEYIEAISFPVSFIKPTT